MLYHETVSWLLYPSVRQNEGLVLSSDWLPVVAPSEYGKRGSFGDFKVSKPLQNQWIHVQCLLSMYLDNEWICI